MEQVVAGRQSADKTRRRQQKASGGFWSRYARSKAALLGLGVIGLEIVVFTLGPVLLQLDPYTLGREFNTPPGAGHILGTDEFGRDLLARLLYGGGVSLFIGMAATLIGMVVGLPLGLLAGYYRGKTETVVMRLADLFLSVPEMVLILVLVAAFRPSVPALTLIIGIMSWPGAARLIYGNTLTVREREYIQAARTHGLSDLRILSGYVVPNVVSPLWMTMPFHCARAILTESALSFLGVGVQPPQASLGNLLYAAQNIVVMSSRPWMWVPAGLCLIATVISINFIGEGIRQALDIRDNLVRP
ncbi:MAG: ABC transporter permease [Gracilibacteraceae bacterium]|jgi:peptide/nickel transport system permease protein|nr:ABC transporter permease [Gracilibacteraceae bacterium]